MFSQSELELIYSIYYACNTFGYGLDRNWFNITLYFFQSNSYVVLHSLWQWLNCRDAAALVHVSFEGPENSFVKFELLSYKSTKEETDQKNPEHQG